MSNVNVNKNGKKGKPIREKDGAVEKGPAKEKEEGSTGSNFKGDQLSPDEDIRPTGPLKDSKGGDSAGHYLQDPSELDPKKNEKNAQDVPVSGPELVVNDSREPPADRKSNRPDPKKPKKKDPVAPPPRIGNIIQEENKVKAQVQQKGEHDVIGNQNIYRGNAAKNQVLIINLVSTTIKRWSPFRAIVYPFCDYDFNLFNSITDS